MRTAFDTPSRLCRKSIHVGEVATSSGTPDCRYPWVSSLLANSFIQASNRNVWAAFPTAVVNMTLPAAFSLSWSWLDCLFPETLEQSSRIFHIWAD